MTLPADKRKELLTLFGALLDGTLSTEQSVSLQEILATSESIRAYYMLFMSIHSGLIWKHDLGESAELRLGDPMAIDQPAVPASGQPAKREPALEEAAQQPEHSTRHSTSSRRASLLDRASRRPVPPSLAISVFVVAAGLMIMAMVHVSEFVAKMHGGTSVDKSIDTPAKFEKLEKVAHLVKMTDAKWVIDRESLNHAQNAKSLRNIEAGKAIHAGEKMYLASGLAEIKFDSGAIVVLQGPAEFEVQGKKQCGLVVGKLVARAEEERAKDFIVETPTARVRDLGTQFVVTAASSGRSEVHVTEGKVAVRVSLGNGEYGDAVEVTEKHAVTVGTDHRVASVTYDGRQRVLALARALSARRDVPIVVPSFELPALNAGELYRSGVQGWATTSNLHGGVSFFGNEFTDPIPHGRQTLYLSEGSVSQVLPETLAPETMYTLTLAVGNRPGPYSPNYTVELLAGKTVLASNHNQAMPAKGRFGMVEVTFACDASHPAVGKPLAIVIKSIGSLRAGTQNHFDAVRLRAEPTVEAFENEPEESLAPATPPSQKPLRHTDTTRKEQL